MRGHLKLLPQVVLLAIASVTILNSGMQTIWAQTPKSEQESASSLLVNCGESLQRGDLGVALQSCEEALVIFRRIKNLKGEGNVLNNLGIIYYQSGNYSKASETLEQALAIAKQISDRAGEVRAVTNLGLVYQEQYNYVKAQDYFLNGLKLARLIKAPLLEAQNLGNLAFLYKKVGDLTQAIEYHQQSLAIFRQLKAPIDEAIALVGLGEAYELVRDYDKAVEYYQQSLAIALQLKNPIRLTYTLTALGSAYFNQRNYPKAAESYQLSLNIATQIKDITRQANALKGLGDVEYVQGKYTQSLDYYQKVLAMSKGINNTRLTMGALTSLGNIYFALNDYSKSVNYYQQGLSLAGEVKDSYSSWFLLNNLGAVFLESGKFADAERTLRLAINIADNLRKDLGAKDAEKVSMFEEQTRTYRLLQRLTIGQKKIEAGLEVAERGRARAFVDLLARQVYSGDTQQAINPLTIEQIRQVAKSQKATIVEYSVITESLKNFGGVLSRQSELFIWVVKPTGEVAFRRVDLKALYPNDLIPLQKVVSTSRLSIGARGRGLGVKPRTGTASLQKLQELHRLLIDPIKDLLPKDANARVILVPQDELFLVPFAALQDQQGKYLIEKHTIFTVPSIQVLDLTRRQKPQVSGKNYLVVGNPIMPSVPSTVGGKPEPLSTLPGAEQEAVAIAQLFKARPLIGKDATKEAVLQKMQEAEVIHFATHGILDDFFGFPGALAFAPDNLSNYRSNLSEWSQPLLKSGEILQLKLNASLVVLSACDTGRGKITGDGVIGLSRSFVSAGVPSVVVSLWSVPDSPTALLMTEFYKSLQTQGDKAIALRQAMLTTMKKHPNPVSWGGFTLVGSAD